MNTDNGKVITYAGIALLLAVVGVIIGSWRNWVSVSAILSIAQVAVTLLATAYSSTTKAKEGATVTGENATVTVSQPGKEVQNEDASERTGMGAA